MRYSDVEAVDATYDLIATLYAIEFQSMASAERAMTISLALAELGEDRSWASVWWAFGALHHDLSDEGFDRALEMLGNVDKSPAARAAALMLTAEIRMTRAAYRDEDPDQAAQVTALAEAARLAPDWPSLRVRLARALVAVGDIEAARTHAQAAVAQMPSEPSADPFDVAITGSGLRRGWAADELEALGLSSDQR